MQISNTQVFHVPVDVVEVVGPDATTYLQGQLSQNVAGLAVGRSAFSLLLAPQGFVEAWFRIVRRETDQYWLVVDSGFGDLARKRLERFKLRVDCSISQQDCVLSAVRWPQFGDVVDKAPVLAEHEMTHIEVDVRWSAGSGFDIVGPTNVDIDNVEVGSLSVFEQLRITGGQPAMGRELTEKTIPAASGVVERSVDFSKGCYVGQELVARVDSRGNNTPTSLYRIDFTEGVVTPDDVVLSEAGEAGTITSAVEVPGTSGSVALAYLKRNTDISNVWVAVDGKPFAGDVAER